MNKRTFSSIIGGSKNDIYQQQSLKDMEKQHDKKQIQYLRKQNTLLKKQLQQIKQIHLATKKQLNLYRNLTTSTKTQSADQYNNRMNEVFQMQQKKIFDLQTQLQILRDKYNKTILNTGSIKQTQYAVKCKQLQKRLQASQKQYQKQISYLKQKLMRVNASEIIQKSNSTNFISSISSDLNGLKPLSSKSRKIT